MDKSLILIFEDQGDISEIFELWIEMHLEDKDLDYKVLTFRDLRTFKDNLDLIDFDSVQSILLDHDLLAGSKGSDVYNLLKRLPVFYKLKGRFIGTSFDNPQEYLKTDGEQIVPKPMSMDDFCRAIDATFSIRSEVKFDQGFA